jgi:hypothetical protein
MSKRGQVTVTQGSASSPPYYLLEDITEKEMVTRIRDLVDRLIFYFIED